VGTQIQSHHARLSLPNRRYLVKERVKKKCESVINFFLLLDSKGGETSIDIHIHIHIHICG
jgi:hypothetical protein